MMDWDISQADAAKAGKNAAEHLLIVSRFLPPILVSAVVWTLFFLPEILQSETDGSRSALFFSRLASGSASAYLALLALDKWFQPYSAGDEQIIATLAFVFGFDWIADWVSHKFLGVKASSVKKR